MARMLSISRLLWSLVITTACGRVGFSTREAPDGAATDDVGPEGVPALATVDPVLALEVACGELVPGPRGLAITNEGGAALEVATADATDGFTVVTAMPLVIAPGQTAFVEVRPPVAVIGTDRAGAKKLGTLALTTNAPMTPSAEIDLVATVVGAELVIESLAGTPLDLDLVGTSGLCPAPVSGVIVNDGNLAVGVQLAAMDGVAIGGFTSGMLAPGAAAGLTIRARTTSECTGAGTISYVLAGQVCSVTPSVLQATFAISGSSTCACS